jgi:hypothetical protein
MHDSRCTMHNAQFTMHDGQWKMENVKSQMQCAWEGSSRKKRGSAQMDQDIVCQQLGLILPERPRSRVPCYIAIKVEMAAVLIAD